MKKKNLLITAIAIFGLATITMAQTIPSYVPTNGLVGWWPFNGNANDESGNLNNGSVNNATLTLDRYGNLNSAYDFNANAQIVCPQNNIPTQAFSLSVWLNQDNSFANMQYVCLGSSASTTWGASASNNNLYVGYGAGCSGNGGGILNTTSITTGNWIHLVYVSSGVGGNTQIYKNGSYAGQAQNSTSIGGCTSQNLYFGVDIFSVSEYIDGKLDDIGMWNRALTQQEITDLYNGCQLSVNTQPTNQTSNINNNAQFVVSSSSPGATYQWQTDLGVGFQNLNNVGQYSGTINDTLTIANTTLSNNNQPFRCIISSGSCTDTSAVAVLTVLCNISVTTQPINQSVNISNNAQFTTASSDPLATYQWQTDLGVGFQNLNSVGQYSGTTNDTLTVSNVTMTNNNQPFRCIITSGSCSDTSNVAILTVNNNMGINETSQDNLFSVYPNPAQHVINVKVDAKLLGSVYNVYDNTGKLVLSGKINSENTVIELGNLSGGIYLFSVGENLKQTFKVIKE